uniref:Flocculation protein FLO11-like n=1 Tax=Nicotiana tabacum TaxID=4097 RepID=A0A1S4DH16_TOBAC
MTSKGKEKMKSKKIKQSVPTTSSMPNMSPPLPRHPLPHPPQLTSLPSTMFTIPPPSNNSVQYYSMPTKGSQSYGGSPAAIPPRFYGSQHTSSPAAAPPSFHGSQHGGSPAVASPIFHGSQHDCSSFVAPSSSSPSSSSIPNISRLDIGGSRPVTSSAASAPSSRRRQNLGGD